MPIYDPATEEDFKAVSYSAWTAVIILFLILGVVSYFIFFSNASASQLPSPKDFNKLPDVYASLSDQIRTLSQKLDKITLICGK